MRDHRPVILTREQVAAEHPAPPVTPTKILRLRLLGGSDSPKIRESVAAGQHTPEDLFATLASDADEGVRCCVARNEHAPLDVLRGLAGDPSERVRGFVAINPVVPPEVVDHLADDPSATVRGLVRWKGEFATP